MTSTGRGAMLLSRAMQINGKVVAKNKVKPAPRPKKTRKIINCWKCQYRTIDETMLDEHMTVQHLVGPDVMRLLARQHPSLLFTTFHREEIENRDREDSIESGIEKLKDTSDEDTEADESNNSIESGIEKLKDTSDKDAEANESNNSKGYIELDTIEVIDTQNNSNGKGDENCKDTFVETPQSDLIVGNVSMTLGNKNIRRNTLREDTRINNSDGKDEDGIDNRNNDDDSTDIQDGHILNNAFVKTPQPDLIVRNVSIESRNQDLRSNTLREDMRKTLKQKAAVNLKQKANLIPGGSKKLKELVDVGEFSNKYKAAEKTKNLIGKHGKEAAENLLKLNNSKVDGIDNKNNGFVLIYKAGTKTYLVNEGVMGNDFVQNQDLRNYIIENATHVEIKMNTSILTSHLRFQYGKQMEQNTPKSQKRKDYRGIGAENKAKKSNKKKTNKNMDDNSESDKTPTTKKKKTQNKNKNMEDNSETDQTPPRNKKKTQKNAHVEKNRDAGSESFESDEGPSWFEHLAAKELDSAPKKKIYSKKPIKQAKQLYPFKCTRCSAKYKTKTNLLTHLRETH